MARLYPETMQSPVLSAAPRSESITTPPPQDFDTPAMEGSMQQFLAENLGEYVVIEFLMGTQELVSKAGVLYAVGTSVVTLYQELSQTFVTCDIFSIKFVTFYLPGHRPWQVSFPRTDPGVSPQGAAGMQGMAPAGAPAPDGIPSSEPARGAPSGGMTGLGQTGMPAPGFAPPMDASGGAGCVGGNCGGGATSPAPSWG